MKLFRKKIREEKRNEDQNARRNKGIALDSLVSPTFEQ